MLRRCVGREKCGGSIRDSEPSKVLTRCHNSCGRELKGERFKSLESPKITPNIHTAKKVRNGHNTLVPQMMFLGCAMGFSDRVTASQTLSDFRKRALHVEDVLVAHYSSFQRGWAGTLYMFCNFKGWPSGLFTDWEEEAYVVWEIATNTTSGSS